MLCIFMEVTTILFISCNFVVLCPKMLCFVVDFRTDHRCFLFFCNNRLLLVTLKATWSTSTIELNGRNSLLTLSLPMENLTKTWRL